MKSGSINMRFSEMDDPKGLCKDVMSLCHCGNGDVEIGLGSTGRIEDIMIATQDDGYASGFSLNTCVVITQSFEKMWIMEEPRGHFICCLNWQRPVYATYMQAPYMRAAQ